ncbi:hypothetical protein [Paraburkholderia tagetis]|uniref:Uncharacterized protein n=1 Tax=Paraburkholderia tagetis TaxID=2913261 RepID=A0A9X1UP13_9BURK|nr:hypothetical protein [Paraburkholderia tagetis]
MEKPVTSPEEFVDEINRRLRDHDCYSSGLRMFLVPRNGRGEDAIGVDWEPRTARNGVIAISETHREVAAEFVVSKYLGRCH